MSLIIKSCLGVCSVIGGCCAISIPLTMNKGNSKELTSVSQIGGGGEINSFDLTKCDEGVNSSNILSSFGDSKTGSYCGKTQNGNLLGKQENSKLTNLFIKMGGNKEEYGNTMNDSFGKSSCIDKSEGGIIFPNGFQAEYLGYCETPSREVKEMNKGVFIEKSKGTESTINLKACLEDCFVENQEVSGIKQFGEKKGLGKEVLFFKTK